MRKINFEFFDQDQIDRIKCGIQEILVNDTLWQSRSKKILPISGETKGEITFKVEEWFSLYLVYNTAAELILEFLNSQNGYTRSVLTEKIYISENKSHLTIIFSYGSI